MARFIKISLCPTPKRPQCLHVHGNCECELRPGSIVIRGGNCYSLGHYFPTFLISFHFVSFQFSNTFELFFCSGWTPFHNFLLVASHGHTVMASGHHEPLPPAQPSRSHRRITGSRSRRGTSTASIRTSSGRWRPTTLAASIRSDSSLTAQRVGWRSFWTPGEKIWNLCIPERKSRGVIV